jgi:4-amino-4-deoxy-L-arabinose transferase-like glycosyltransferase
VFRAKAKTLPAQVPSIGFSSMTMNGSRLKSLADWCSRDHRRALLTLLFGSLVLLLPGFVSFPVTPRDESRFAQPSKQMVESGNYVDIRLQGVERYRKPVGIYWLQAGSVNAAEAIGFKNARHHIAFYRVPSLLGILGGVLLTYWVALLFASRPYAILAGLSVAASTLGGLEARIATTDGVMMLTAVAAFGALAHIYFAMPGPSSRWRAWGLPMIFWSAIGCSLLIKGPVLATMAGLAIALLVLFDRSARWLYRLKPFTGVLWMALLVLPWLIAIYFQSKGVFFERSMSRDLFSRLTQPAEGHWGPPGYFWLLFWVTFWPAAAFGPLATAFAWRNRTDPRVRFLIAWIVPGWILLEIVVTKLPHYILPLYPGIAILIVYALEKRMLADLGMRIMGALWPAFTIFTAVGLYLLATRFEGRLDAVYWIAAAVAVVLSMLAARELWQGRSVRALVIALACAAANMLAIYWVIPQVREINFVPRLAQIVNNAPCSSPAMTSGGYNEPNLVFLTNTGFHLAEYGRSAARFMHKSKGCSVGIIESRERPSFDQEAQKLGLSTVKIGEDKGFDIANWRHSRFDVLMRK